MSLSIICPSRWESDVIIDSLRKAQACCFWISSPKKKKKKNTFLEVMTCISDKQSIHTARCTLIRNAVQCLKNTSVWPLFSKKTPAEPIFGFVYLVLDLKQLFVSAFG